MRFQNNAEHIRIRGLNVIHNNSMPAEYPHSTLNALCLSNGAHQNPACGERPCLELLKAGAGGIAVADAVLPLHPNQAQIKILGGRVEAAAGCQRTQHQPRGDRVLVQPRPRALRQVHSARTRACSVMHRHIHLMHPPPAAWSRRRLSSAAPLISPGCSLSSHEQVSFSAMRDSGISWCLDSQGNRAFCHERVYKTPVGGVSKHALWSPFFTRSVARAHVQLTPRMGTPNSDRWAACR